MGRKHKNKDDIHLPKNVYRGRSSYEYRPYSKGVKRPCFKLCSLSSPISEVWKKFEKREGRPSYNLTWLLNEYYHSPQFRKKGSKLKSKDTIKEQERQIQFLAKYTQKNGRSFGSAELKNITKGTIRRYLDKREEDGAPVAGNREKSLISKAWNWALERDLIESSNPCMGVSRNPESPRDRYVTDQEYEITYKLAQSPPYLPIMMELAYLCRMRKSEILKATKHQVKEKGFDTKRLKGSRDTLTLWSDRLNQAIQAAYELASKVSHISDDAPLIHDKWGVAIKKSAFESAWQRLKTKMKEAGIEPFTFHDLKAKGVSDFEGNKQDASGHKTPAQVATYDRKKKEVKPTK